MKANAALVGTARIVMLDAEALKDLQRAIVHAHRDAESVFPHRPAQHLRHAGLQVEQPGYMIELPLCHFQRVDWLRHALSPASEF